MSMRDGLSRRDQSRLAEWSLRPSILLLGCQPYARCAVTYRTPPPIDLRARRGEIHSGSHIRDRRPEFAGYRVESPCPVCGDSVQDLRPTIEGELPAVVICLRCSRMDPRHNRILGAARKSADIAREGKDTADKAERDLSRVSTAARRGGVILSESERRRIWCGNRRTMLAAHIEAVTNLAAAGRRFLLSIDQPPNFDRILDARGKITGYWSELERQAAELLAAESALNVAPELVAGLEP